MYIWYEPYVYYIMLKNVLYPRLHYPYIYLCINRHPYRFFTVDNKSEIRDENRWNEFSSQAIVSLEYRFILFFSFSIFFSFIHSFFTNLSIFALKPLMHLFEGKYFIFESSMEINKAEWMIAMYGIWQVSMSDRFSDSFCPIYPSLYTDFPMNGVTTRRILSRGQKSQ